LNGSLNPGEKGCAGLFLAEFTRKETEPCLDETGPRATISTRSDRISAGKLLSRGCRKLVNTVKDLKNS